MQLEEDDAELDLALPSFSSREWGGEPQDFGSEHRFLGEQTLVSWRSWSFHQLPKSPIWIVPRAGAETYIETAETGHVVQGSSET